MNEQIDVICCTSAFGMGINKKNIRYVLHFHYPTELESYVQEIGRAARDGKPSLAILLYSEEDQGLARMLIEGQQIPDYQLKQILDEILQIADWNPQVEQMMIERVGCHEIAWRTIRYQLEIRGVLRYDQIKRFSPDSMFVSIREQQQEHLYQKKEKLAIFERWIGTSGCRREALLAYFSEKIDDKPDECCDRCGATLAEFESVRDENAIPALAPWEEALAELCCQKEIINQ